VAGLPAPVAAWWVLMPVPYLVIVVSSPEEVAAARPDMLVLGTGPSGEATYLVAESDDGVKVRFFAPRLGVDEDPATGSAAAALAAVRSSSGERSGSLLVSQGDEIGRPSTIEVSWEGDVVTLVGTVRRDETRVLQR
jgi:trans-2,3-dihydro-3-hydroxyanthranilate isomerase